MDSSNSTWWKNRSLFLLFYSMGTEDYAGSVREDDINSFGLSLDYSMRQYLDWKLYYNYSERDSNIGGLDYDRNRIGLQASFAL